MVEIKKFLLCLPAELREAIRKEAERKGISSNSLVVTILWKHFQELASQHKPRPGGKDNNMKKIIYLKVDENKNAEVLKPDSMEAKECISLMLGAAVWYYKQHYNVGSIEKATAKVGVELLNSVGIPTKIFF